MRSSKPVLLVEDDDVDAMTVTRAVDDLEIAGPLARVTDGEEALKYLRNRGNEKPCIIFLDLNMPRMNGAEFLKVVKADDTLKRVPIIVLTASKEQCDIVGSFDLCVAGYIVKPVDYERFVQALKTIDLYWTLSELPNGRW
ncbi:MAG: response regulator [Sedimentisphaerales bacterium]|nr:response regulator [Sedimentisphaerales bacterium]